MFLLLGTIEVYLQSSTSDVFEFNFITYPDGDYVSCREHIYIDSLGFLWVATETSLLQYDGKNLINYSESNSLPIKDIHLYQSDSNGNLILVSSDNNFYTFNPYTKQIIAQTKLEDKFKPKVGLTISNEQSGSIFPNNFIIPNDSGGFYALLKSDNSYHYYIFFSEDGSDLQLKKSFVLDGIASVQFFKNQILLSNPDAILRYDTSFNVLSIDSLRFSQTGVIPFLHKDEESTIWAYENCTSSNCKVYFLNDKDSQFEELIFPQKSDLQDIHKIISVDNNLWLIGVNKLILFDRSTASSTHLFSTISKSFEYLDSPPLISHYTSVGSSKDLLWLTSGYGLVQINRKTEPFKLSLRSHPVFCNGYCSMRGMDEDKDGNLWLASYGGLFKKAKNDSIVSIDKLRPYISIGVYSLTVDDPYLLMNDVLFHLENGNIKEIIPEKVNGHVTNIKGSESEFWLSTCYNNGDKVYFYQYDPELEKRTTIHLPPSLQYSGQMTDLLLSKSKKDIFITTALRGTFKFNIESQEFYSLTPTEYWDKSKSKHFCVYEMNGELLYVGTSNNLLEIDLNTEEIQQYQFPKYSSKLSSEDRNFFSILSENDSTLWMGTDHGIVSFNTNTKKFKPYIQLGDLGTQEFNRESAYKNKDGTFLFGSVNGVYEFSSEDVRAYNNSNKEKLNILSVKHFDGKSEELTTSYEFENKMGLHFQHNDKMFTFKVSQPEYRRQQNVYYSYYLDGFLDEWSEPTEQNEFTFTKLTPGSYSLEIKAGNEAQSLDSNLISIPIEVSEPWYMSLWFWLLLTLACISLLYAIFKLRYLQLLKYEQLRTDISRNLHDDVGTILTGIAMQSELMQKFANEDIKQLAISIAERSREAMGNMRDTVWAIDSRKDSTLDLKERIQDYIMDTLYHKDISYTLNSNIKNSDTKIMPDIRQNVYLIAKESINNIVKHSDTNRVDILLDVSKKRLRLKIQDYGVYKPSKKTGQGLQNMENRATTLGGTYRFEYSNGFKTTLEIPLN